MATTAITQKHHFTRALQSQPFAFLWFGQSISVIGDLIFAVALAWQVLTLTGSATAMGLVEIVWSTPFLITLLLGGVVADRVSPRTVMVISDSVRGAVVLILGVLSWAHLLHLWYIVILAVIFGSIEGFFYPAYGKMPPTLLERGELRSANALTQLTRQMTGLIGPLVGASVIVTIGLPSSFAFDGLTFAISVACLLSMRMPPIAAVGPPASESASPEGLRNAIKGIRAEMREGFAIIRGSTWLWVSILVSSIGNMCFLGPRLVALPKLVLVDYHGGVWLLGLITAGGTLGGIVGTIIVGRAATIHRRGMLAYGGMLFSSIALFGYALPLSSTLMPVVATLSAACVGLGVSVYGLIWTTLMQELVPSDKLGRVGSVDMLGSFGLQPVAFGLAGLLADRFPPTTVFAIAGVMSVAASLAALSVKAIRQMD